MPPEPPKVFLNLDALRAKAQAQVRLSKDTIKARIAQRVSAEAAADAYARSLEKRHSLERALSANDQDAMRFRWLAEHPEVLPRLASSTLAEMRRDIDLWIKQEAIRRLSEMRRSQASSHDAHHR
jgi:hypothetical protein